MKLQLTLTVDYAPNGATSELLALTLEQAAQHLENGGLLSGNTGAEVASFSFRAVEIDPLAENPLIQLDRALRALDEASSLMFFDVKNNVARAIATLSK